MFNFVLALELFFASFVLRPRQRSHFFKKRYPMDGCSTSTTEKRSRKAPRFGGHGFVFATDLVLFALRHNVMKRNAIFSNCNYGTEMLSSILQLSSW